MKAEKDENIQKEIRLLQKKLDELKSSLGETPPPRKTNSGNNPEKEAIIKKMREKYINLV